MKLRTHVLSILALSLIPGAAPAQLWITNFETAAGELASGVWRNSTTSTDLAIPVTLTQSGAVFDEESILDNTANWQDILYDLFNPNYVGDYVSLEVAGLATASVTIDFNTEIVDPVLNFTDVDKQTTLVFNSPPTKVGGAPNLLIVGNTVTTDKTPANPFDPDDVETAGSLKFTGTFTELAFTIVNVGPSQSQDDDRTGFSVSTTVEPVTATPTDMLAIWLSGDDVHLSWPTMSTFSAIQYSTNLHFGPWMPLPGASPGTTTTWSAPRSSLGSEVYFRGVY